MLDEEREPKRKHWTRGRRCGHGFLLDRRKLCPVPRCEGSRTKSQRSEFQDLRAELAEIMRMHGRGEVGATRLREGARAILAGLDGIDTRALVPEDRPKFQRAIERARRLATLEPED